MALTACQTMYEVGPGDYILHVRSYDDLHKEYRLFGGDEKEVFGFTVKGIYPNEIWIRSDRLSPTTLHEIRHLNEDNWHD